MITLCVPTRGRPGRFETMLASANATATDFEVVAVRDVDDTSVYQKHPNVIYEMGYRPTNRTGNVQMSGLWTKAWEAGTGNIAMLAADDIVFETANWDKEVEDAIDSFPDRLGMVYCCNPGDERPVLPFVSREWIDIAGFTPDDWPGWMVDEHIWSIASELGRVIYLENVIIKHDQFGSDQTYWDAMRAREEMGGLESLRRRLYSAPKLKERDELTAKLRAATNDKKVLPESTPEWMEMSLWHNANTRWHLEQQTMNTLISVHCYSGDKDLVKRHLPVYEHHEAPVVFLSPEDAPMKLRGKTCVSIGGRGYVGQVSLDRQRAHLEHLLTYPQRYFLLCDADAFCISPTIPEYVYKNAADGIVFSNEVLEWRPHQSPYPKIAMQPPYFLTRESIMRMLSVADKPEVQAHPITPFIDWYMLALCREAGLRHQNFRDGASFPSWRWNYNDIPETVEMGNDFKMVNNPLGEIRGDLNMRKAVEWGAVFLHSIKHKEVFEDLLDAHQVYLGNGEPTPNTLTVQEYVRRREETGETFTVEAAGPGFTEGETIRI